MPMKGKVNLSFKPLSESTWPDLEQLFGERGACGGCWCMTWRMSAKDYEKSKGAGNKKRLKQLVSQNEYLGILAYHEQIPIAWCSVSPKPKIFKVHNSRNLKSDDSGQVWSVICFFVCKSFRNKGVSRLLLKSAAQYARTHGAKILESYPVIKKDKNIAPVFAFTGISSIYAKAGFQEVPVKQKSRVIMRLEL
jgi:GNAT superfamily N-acetyltransferase